MGGSARVEQTNWSVYCQTEDRFIYTTSVDKPTTCPHDDTHTIVPLYTTAVSSSLPLTNQLHQVRLDLSPRSSAVTYGPVWQKIGGFQMPAKSAFHDMSVAVSTPTAFPGDFRIRLYEPASDQVAAELVGTDSVPAGVVHIVSCSEFSPITGGGPFTSTDSLYMEVDISSVGSSTTVDIQEVCIHYATQ